MGTYAMNVSAALIREIQHKYHEASAILKLGLYKNLFC